MPRVPKAFSVVGGVLKVLKFRFSSSPASVDRWLWPLWVFPPPPGGPQLMVLKNQGCVVPGQKFFVCGFFFFLFIVAHIVPSSFTLFVEMFCLLYFFTEWRHLVTFLHPNPRFFGPTLFDDDGNMICFLVLNPFWWTVDPIPLRFVVFFPPFFCSNRLTPLSNRCRPKETETCWTNSKNRPILPQTPRMLSTNCGFSGPFFVSFKSLATDSGCEYWQLFFSSTAVFP